MKRLLIRADDLGFSEGTNHGIAKSVKEGIIRSVGLMPNMPAAQHGFDLIRDCDVCLGQHTNICVGKPLTDPALIPSITGEDGEFRPSSAYRAAKEDFVVLDEVVLEIEAQYQRFKEITGREPSYFEGHAVASANFFKGLAIVAKRHGLDYLALNFDGSPIRFGKADLYMCMDSMKPDYDPFASLVSCMENAHEGGVEMFVCHPGYLDAYILRKSSLTVPRAMEVEMLCSDETKRYIDEQGIELVTYDDLK
ncbi:MAG: ChbG/HpnK family deacetylase [Lachnospiraceae bacterium]|nr:ChbG/HpnK family deacetylase [Lachnospiraceae bacterium]MBQ9048983.1 ChbG/HpnK family deacetylase [Lachnospiraceae bacterium]